jgi:acylphosphatase
VLSHRTAPVRIAAKQMVAMNVCKRVIYTGRVQGIGFRFTAQRLSHGRPIAGTVRNCSDGSVELYVQGKASDVQEFLTDLARQLEDFITGQTIRDAEPKAMEGFQIIK